MGHKSRFFITGDCHRNFDKIYDFCKNIETTTDDIMIIAGDAGINWYLDPVFNYDKHLKLALSHLPITLVIVHGNHEERAWNCHGYKHDIYKVGCDNILAWAEPEFPNILFVDDFSIQCIKNRRFLFMGGAYSIDKWQRLMYGGRWFESEQMSKEDMEINLKRLVADRKAFEYSINHRKNQFDYVVSHTCPLKYEPTEVFLAGVDQSKVDKRTEKFLDEVEDIISYGEWIAAHFHVDKVVDRVRFIYNDIIELE